MLKIIRYSASKLIILTTNSERAIFVRGHQHRFLDLPTYYPDLTGLARPKTSPGSIPYSSSSYSNHIISYPEPTKNNGLDPSCPAINSLEGLGYPLHKIK